MNRISFLALAAMSAVVCSAAQDGASASETKVIVDFGTVVGPVKPVNGVGQPPMIGKLGGWTMFHYLKEAGIPYSRLHDVSGWLAGGLFVDIPNIFPDFGADENDPASYRFAYTDSLMKALEANGVEPFFRLGVTIENFVERGYPPVNIMPPKDFAKWGRICEHVIRHYTEGWADGFRMKVTYWEIWNEPDNNPDESRNPMFRGPFSEYIRLYGAVAPYLKEKFPHLKIGGYGSCGFYAGVGSDHVAAANSSPRMEYFVECARKFLSAARNGKWPLDFFSYHSYSEPAEALRQVRFADELLDEYGFTTDRCERIFNEWLPYVGHKNIGSALQASGVAAELIGLQNGPCDLACVYDARCGVGNYSPLFNPLTYKPHKAYYAFMAFNELRKRGKAVAVKVDGDRNLWVAAAKGEGDAAVMMANDSDASIPLSCDFGGMAVSSCLVTDKERTNESVAFPSELPPRSFAVIVLAGGHGREGFYRTRKDADGRWWIVSPEGKDVFIRGVDHANWNGHFCEALGCNPYREENKKRYSSQSEWESETIVRLKEWGFNALGAGCSPELRRRGLLHIEFLGVGQAFCAKGGECEISKFQGIPGSAFPNVFHPDFAAFCDARARKMCAPQRDDRSILGYFFDNELAWRAGGAASTGMFDAVAKMPKPHSARAALDAFLAEHGIDAEDANVKSEVKIEFLRLAARRYFEAIASAVCRYDPNHLLLGARFAGLSSAHQVVWEEAGRICDVLTFNNYPWADLDENVVYFSRKDKTRAADAYALRHSWTKKPMIITEWSFPALDSGLPCSGGAGQRFNTQAERVRATELFARTLLALPFMVGYDYFMWVDEPALGISRNFLEDSNYGLVNECGEPYPGITSMFARLNREAEALHAKGEMPHARAVDRTAQENAAVFPMDASAECANAVLTRSGDAYTLSTPAGLVLKGRVGGEKTFDSVLVDGLECGPFTFMLYHGDYQDIDSVESVEWLAERGALRIAGVGAKGAKSFRLVYDVMPFAEKPWFAVNVVSVENTCREDFSDIKVFFRQYAPWSGDWAKGGYRAPQNVWKAPASAVWIRSADGAWCGGASYAQTVRYFIYWISGDGAPHPDAMFSPVGSTRLAAGAVWRPEGKVWMVAAAGRGGADGWRRFLAEFADTQSGGIDLNSKAINHSKQEKLE